MLDALLHKLLLVVLGFVQTNNQRNSHLLEDRHVVVRRERAISISLIQWAREGNELAWHGPVEVAVLHLFKVLVLLHIEGLVVVPAEGHCVLQTSEAMVNRALVGASSHGGIAEGQEFIVVRLEHSPGFLVTLAEHDYHVAAHQKSCVGLLGVVHHSVVIDLELRVAAIEHQLLELLAELVHFAQVQRPKVGKERLVDQVIVDAEVEGVLPRFGRVFVADPVEPIADDLDGLVRAGALAIYHYFFIKDL
jgi:hypothetical protein